MYLTLSDVDICKTKDDNIKKMMKEYNELETDLKTVQNLCEKNITFNPQNYFNVSSRASIKTSLSSQRVGRGSEVSAWESVKTGFFDPGISSL